MPWPDKEPEPSSPAHADARWPTAGLVEGDRGPPGTRRSHRPALGARRGAADSPATARQARLGVCLPRRDRRVAGARSDAAAEEPRWPRRATRSTAPSERDISIRCPRLSPACHRHVQAAGTRARRGDRCRPRRHRARRVVAVRNSATRGSSPYPEITLHRRPAAREPLARSRPGVLRRRPDRGDHRAAGPTHEVAGGLAHVGDEPEGPETSGFGNRAGAGHRCRRRGQCPARGRARAHLDPIDSCGDRQAPVGA